MFADGSLVTRRRPGYTPAMWPSSSTPSSEHSSATCSTSSAPGHRRSLSRGLAERRRRALALRDFTWLTATLRSGPPPGFFRIGWVRRVPNLNEFFVHHEDVRRANGRAPRTNEHALDAALWRNVTRAPWFLARRLHGAGLELRWAGTAYTVRARRGEPTARIAGPPGELLLYLFGRRSAAHVHVSGPDAAIEAVRRARFGM